MIDGFLAAVAGFLRASPVFGGAGAYAVAQGYFTLLGRVMVGMTCRGGEGVVVSGGSSPGGDIALVGCVGHPEA
ncbi:hypothetical protein [Amycolatopsis sp. Poz14]|uniref:hypothetical protein n=1 Tax=Amycolatopsis sp. Poz14 TaxID=1447705 RepID=UPI001EE91B76|nr:hypothetical protein [Amycolatopsis sp. Poz14]MCG3755869.1 hypothetical protein [Amycolatopsis sp. Poz14]